MTTLEDKSLWETTPDEELLGADIMKASTEEIVNRTRLLDNDIKVRRRHQESARRNSPQMPLVRYWNVLYTFTRDWPLTLTCTGFHCAFVELRS